MNFNILETDDCQLISSSFLCTTADGKRTDDDPDGQYCDGAQMVDIMRKNLFIVHLIVISPPAIGRGTQETLSSISWKNIEIFFIFS